MRSIWSKTLTFVELKGKPPYIAIARAIRRKILDNTLPAGVILPPRKEVAILLDVAKSEVDAAWKKLEVLGLIERASNSFKVADIYEVQESKKANGLEVAFNESGRRKIFLDQSTYRDDALENRGVANIMRRSFAHVDLRNDVHEEAGINRELIETMRYIVNDYLFTNYSQEQLIYNNDSKLLMYQICAVIVTPKSVVVICGVAPSWVLNSFRETNRKVFVLEMNEDGFPIAELKEIRRQNTIGMLYIASRLAAPGNYELNLSRIDELLALIRADRFVVLEHDYNAGLLYAEENSMMKILLDQKFAVLYVRTFSNINSQFDKINILTGPQKKIKSIKEKMLNMSSSMSPVIANKVIQVATKDALYKAEKLVAETMIKTLNPFAKEILSQYDFLNQELIKSSRSCFFQLEAVYGEWPYNVHEILAEERIYIFNFLSYVGMKNGHKAIMISIADYPETKLLARDLHYVMGRLSNLLIRPDMTAVNN